MRSTIDGMDSRKAAKAMPTNIMPSISIAFLILLSACSTPGPVVVKTVLIEVEKRVYVPLPEASLSECDSRPAPLGPGYTNGELRSVALAWQNLYGPCLEGKLSAIRALQP